MTGRNQNKSSKITRRRLLGVAGAGIAASAFPYFYVKRAAAQTKRLVIYNFDGSLGKFYKEFWMDPFAEEHGLEIETITMQGSAPPMAKIKAQVDAGEPDADVIPMQLTDYVFATRNDLLIPIERDEVPEYENLYPQFITDHGPGLGIWSYGLCYNTDRITERPDSWQALWDPAYKDKVGLNEALFEQALQMVNLAYKGEPTPVDEETFQHLTQLRPNLVSLWSTGAQAEQLMRTEEAWMSPLWNGRVFRLADQGIPLDFVVPKEGFFVRYNPYCIPKGAQNPEWAKRWINYICNAERQRQLAENLYYASPNKLVTYSGDIAKRVVVSSPEVAKLAITEDFEAIVDKSAEWRRMWDAWKQT